MYIKCPMCRGRTKSRTSRSMTVLTTEVHHQCLNIECGCTFKSMTEVTALMNVGAMPNPAVILPVVQRKPKVVNPATPARAPR